MTASWLDARQRSEEAGAVLGADLPQDLQATRSRLAENSLETDA